MFQIQSGYLTSILRFGVKQLSIKVTGCVVENKTSCSPNLTPAILCNRETSVTGEPAVSTGFEAGF